MYRLSRGTRERARSPRSLLIKIIVGTITATLISVVGGGPVLDRVVVDSSFAVGSFGGGASPAEAESRVHRLSEVPVEIFVGSLRPSVDPTLATVPPGLCASIIGGAVGYQNETGTLADTYLMIGRSVTGRPLWAEHWGSSAGPQVLIVGQVHGDECSPAWLVRAVRNNPPVNFGIWLVPTLNPDGLARHTRRNRDGVDLNRDGRNTQSPEARALLAVTSALRPTLAIHLHSPLRWVGWYGSPLARRTADAVADHTKWSTVYTTGSIDEDDSGYLWEGQAEVVEGLGSVMIEYPGVARNEASNTVNPSANRYVSVREMERLSRATMAALTEVFDSPR